MSADSRNTLPDHRIARAFDFTLDDLNANRSGVLSLRQRGFSDWIAYRILYFLRHLPILNRLFSGSMSPKKEPYRVQAICGRIQLEHYIVDKRLIRSSLFYEYYHLVFPGHNRTFRINRNQYHALVENLRYRVYYQDFGEQRHILSIERILGKCEDA